MTVSTTARQSKLKFLDSADITDGDYECMICYTELEPNSGLIQTGCCLKLACTSCMMKAFYHSLMARDQTFKCPMCRGIIVEVPGSFELQPHNDDIVVDFAGNLDSFEENTSQISDFESDIEDTVPNNLVTWYQARLAEHGSYSLTYNPEVTQLGAPLITESTARYTTWSHINGKVCISFFTGAPHTILVRFDDLSQIVRWNYDNWEIASIGVTQYSPDTLANQPIYVTIISKPLADGTHNIIVREVNFDYTVISMSIHLGLPTLDHKAKTDFNHVTRDLCITLESGGTVSMRL